MYNLSGKSTKSKRPVCIQFYSVRMCGVVGTDNNESFQFDVAGERYVEQELFVRITFNILLCVCALG